MRCRNCKNISLESIWDLGNVPLSGYFPREINELVPAPPIELGICTQCGLAQLMHNYDLSSLYGESYGYQSNLNKSMSQHLIQKVEILSNMVNLKKDDVTCDIGCNDGTLINSYKNYESKRVGIDPIANKFVDKFSNGVKIVNDFFTKDQFFKSIDKKAKVITSVAMLYDLEDPNQFMSDIREVLDQDGVWHFEQSYAPWMIKSGAFDTVCHEHLEYYTYTILENMLNANDLKVIDLELNMVNGGSLAITAAHANSNIWKDTSPIYAGIIKQNESENQVDSVESWIKFKYKANRRIEAVKSLIEKIESRKESLAALGASTKGNILLHSLGEHAKKIKIVGEVNSEKFNKYTSSARIKIKPEQEVIQENYNYYLILPWHFKQTFKKLKQVYKQNIKMITPLPEIEMF